MGAVSVAVIVVWLLGVSRVAVAISRDEPGGAEPCLAALLSVGPPIALLFRGTRELLGSDVEIALDERDDQPSVK